DESGFIRGRKRPLLKFLERKKPRSHSLEEFQLAAEDGRRRVRQPAGFQPRKVGVFRDPVIEQYGDLTTRPFTEPAAIKRTEAGKPTASLDQPGGKRGLHARACLHRDSSRSGATTMTPSS